MELTTRIEALLFATDQPLGITRLCEALHEEQPVVETALRELDTVYAESDRAFRILHIAGGYQLATKPEYADLVRRLYTGKRRVRLTKAALEALSIIAYKQPTTRPEIDAIRGVASGGVLETLLERNLIRISGRSEGVGRPLLYATTPEFLQYLGLNAVDDLPSLQELESMLAERETAARLEEEEELLTLAEVAGAERDPEKATGDETTDGDLPTLDELDQELREKGERLTELSARLERTRATESDPEPTEPWTTGPTSTGRSEQQEPDVSESDPP